MKRELEELKNSAKKPKIDEQIQQSQNSASTSDLSIVLDDFDKWVASEDFDQLSQSLIQNDMTPLKESEIKQEDETEKPEIEIEKEVKSKKI